MTKTLRLVWGLLLLALCAVSHAEEIRDYYAEPGIQAFKGFEGEFVNERIDTFGGTLQLGFTDLVVPGNGGLDIRVTRTFTSHQAQLQYPQFMGMGWTMHYGRIVVPYRNRDKVCVQRDWAVSTNDNPSLELPDGARELLVLDDYSGAPDAYLITKSNWKVTCNLTGSGGFTVKSPDGTTYLMDKQFVGDQQTVAWYTSRITDKNGNTLDFTYDSIATATGPQNFPTSITASDGRVVTYTYQNNLLYQIKLGTKVMATYEYSPAQGLDWSIQPQNLVKVTLPEGRVWNYTYNPKQIDPATGGPLPSSNQLATLQYPTGAKVTYTYQPVVFDQQHQNQVTFALQGKSIYTATDPNTPKGSWTYTYAPESYYVAANQSSMDVVTIDGPESRIKYYYYGTGYVRYSIDALWTVGLPYMREVYEKNATTPVEVQTYAYDKRLVSNENFWHGGTEVDNYTWAAVKTSEFTKRDGQSGGVITYYENYDAFGNPRTVRQWGNTNTAPSWKVSTTVYQNDVNNWVIGLPTQVTVADDANNTPKTTITEYDTHFRPFRVTTAGVVTSTTYYDDGNVHTVTDPRTKVTTYEDYYRGQARLIKNPDLTQVSRVVDDMGRITSITNEVNQTRGFTYDDLGRLTDIAYPEGAPVHIFYDLHSKTLTRGNYQEVVDTDGWGRETTITRKDLQTNSSIVITNEYSAEGKKTFTSYPSDTTGTHYQYDALGRLFEVKHPDNKAISTVYAGNQQTVTDEKGNVRVLLYHNYGAFDGGQLVSVEERNVSGDDPGTYATTVNLNVHGQPVQVMQGILGADGYITGKARSYTYDSRFYLQTEVNPETGTTTYTRDDAGNMLTKQVGSLPAVSFQYDDRSRLHVVDYPDSTAMTGTGILAGADATYEYYNDGAVHTTSKGGVVREYQYTPNGNLDWEKLTVDGVTLTADYAYNNLDYVSSITYPSGRTISYNPDALGRARQVGSLIPMVEYYPTGQIKTLTHANGVTTAIQLNSRKMVQALQTYGSQGDLINRTFSYDDTQNITSITDLVTPSKSRSYQYDELGRLRHATTPWGEMDYGYSRNDELTRIQVGTTTTALTYANGQLYKRGDRYYVFDGMGNMTSNQIINSQFPQGGDQYDFVYDQSGSLRTATRAGWLAPKAWRYDVEGMRVLNESAGSAPTYYFHNKAGQLLGEYGANVAYGKETIYLGSQAVATVKTNEPPLANAGADASVFSGQQATLNGSASSDPEGRPITYAWQQISGPTAQVSGASTSSLVVTAPTVSTASTLSFQLTVTDEKGDSAQDVATVAVNPHIAPVANAGPDQGVMAGTTVTLDGSASTGDGALSYYWSQTSGPAITITNAGSAQASFIAPAVAADSDVVLQLRVTDNYGAVATDTMVVHVFSATADTDSDGLPDGWERLYFGSITLYNGASDPDADGLSNAQEYDEGSNPLVAEAIPAMPTALATEGGAGSALLQWARVKGAARYGIYWSTTPGVALGSANKITTTSTRYVQTGLTNGLTYYYRVVAENSTGQSAPTAETAILVNARSWQKSATQNWVDTTAYDRYSMNWTMDGSTYFRAFSITVLDKLTNRSYVTTVTTNDPGSASSVSTAIKVGPDGSVTGVTYTNTLSLHMFYIPPRYSGTLAANNMGQYCTNCSKELWNQSEGFGILYTPDNRAYVYFPYMDWTVSATKVAAYCAAGTNTFATITLPIVGDAGAPFHVGDVQTGVASDGKIYHAWIGKQTSQTNKTLSVREVNCATQTARSVLDQTNSAVGSSPGTIYPQVSVSSAAVSTYFNNGTTIYGKDYNRSTSVWGADYVLPATTGYTPKQLMALKNANGIEAITFVGATSKGVTHNHVLVRAPGASWSTPLDLGDLGTGYGANVSLVTTPTPELFISWWNQGGTDTTVMGGYVRSATAQGVWGTAQKLSDTGVTQGSIGLSGSSFGNLQASVNGTLWQYRPGVPDLVPPVTTSTKTKYTSKGATYIDITLTANEPATTNFRVTGAATITAGGAASTNWQVYTTKVTVKLTGTGSLDYYSKDTAGNTEATHTEALQ